MSSWFCKRQHHQSKLRSSTIWSPFSFPGLTNPFSFCIEPAPPCFCRLQRITSEVSPPASVEEVDCMWNPHSKPDVDWRHNTHQHQWQPFWYLNINSCSAVSKGDTYRFEEVVTVYDLPLPYSGVQYENFGKFLTEMYVMMLNFVPNFFVNERLYRVSLYKVLFWNFRFLAIWSILDPSGQFWTIVDTTGIFWTVLIILDHFGPSGQFWAVLDCSGPFWAVLDRSGPSGPFWAVLDGSGPFWAVLDRSGPF